MLDAAGNQVGTGVSAQLLNNDPDNAPSTVAFPIKEIPAAINASTVFTRTDTTAFAPASGATRGRRRQRYRHRRRQGHPRSDRASTISTRPVWPASCGSRTTCTGCAASRWPRTAPPSPSAARPAGVRPPPVPAVRRVRRRDADWATTCCWNPTTPRRATTSAPSPSTPPPGALTLGPDRLARHLPPADVDAAALHSSGRVVAVHTDSGRLAHVLPANTPRPPLAAYSAGPGTEIGLLSLTRRRRRHQPRHRPRPRSRRLPARRLRPDRQPRPLLRRTARPRRWSPARGSAGVSRLHPAAPLRHLPRPRRRRRQPDLPALLHAATAANPRLPHRRLQPHRRPRSPPTAPAPTSPTSPSTTGAASTPPTTPPSPTPPPTNPTSTPPSTSPNPPSAASTR